MSKRLMKIYSIALTTVTVRPQSTTPTQTDALALAKRKRLRKPRYAKYVELLEGKQNAFLLIRNIISDTFVQ